MERELRRAVMSGGVWVISGRAISAVASLAVTALVTHRATAGDTADYFLAISIIVTAAGLAQLGVNFTLIRMAAQSIANGEPGRARGAITTTLRFSLGVATLLAVIAAGAAPFAPAPRVIVAIGILFYTLQAVTAEALRGLHAISGATIAGTMVAPLVALAGVAVAAPTLPQILIAITFSYLIAGAAGLLLLRKRTKPLGPSEPLRMSALTAAALPAWISGVALLLFAQADLWIAAALLPATSVAIYGAASRLALTLILPLIVVNSVIAPMIADLFARDRLQQLQLMLRGTAALAAMPAIAVILVLAFAGRTILDVVFGPGYGDAAPLVLLLSAGQTANVLTGSCGLALLMTGHDRIVMRVSATVLPLTVLAGAASARAFGAIGIAATFAIGLAVMNIVLAIAVRRTIGLRTWAGLGALLALLRGERRAA